MASSGRRVHTLDEGHRISIAETVTITERIAGDEGFTNRQAHARDESFTGDEAARGEGDDYAANAASAAN